jgi:hypothetical protein
LEIFGDCLLQDLTWESCVLARSKSSFPKNPCQDLRYGEEHEIKIELFF